VGAVDGEILILEPSDLGRLRLEAALTAARAPGSRRPRVSDLPSQGQAHNPTAKEIVSEALRPQAGPAGV